MKRMVFIFCAVLSVAVAAQEVQIPSNLKLCRKESANYNACLKDAIQDAIPKFAKGIPELGIPELDPFVTESQVVEYGNNWISGKLAIKNVRTYGSSRAQVENVRMTTSEDTQRLQVGVAFSRIFIEGEYKADGHLGDFNVGGKGMFNLSMEGIRTVWDISGRIENDRWIVEHFRIQPEVEKMKVYFDDLFNGNEAINAVARNFVNEYWPLLYRELLPIVSVEWDKQMTDFVNTIFSKLSYSKLFA